MPLSRFFTPILCTVIVLGASFAGFIYTNSYSGWGHYFANAVPIGFGLGMFAGFVAAIVVSQMPGRPTTITLSGFAAFWVLAATLLFLNAPAP